MYHRTITYYLSPYQYNNNNPSTPIKDKFTTKHVSEMSTQNITEAWVFLLFDALHIIIGYNTGTMYKNEIYYDPRLLSERRRNYLPQNVQQFLNKLEKNSAGMKMLEDVKTFLKRIRRHVDRTMYVGKPNPANPTGPPMLIFPTELHSRNTRNTFIIFAAHKIAEQAMSVLNTSEPELTQKDRNNRVRDLRNFLSKKVIEPSGYISHINAYAKVNFLFPIHPKWKYVGKGASMAYTFFSSIGDAMAEGVNWIAYKNNQALNVDKIELEDEE
ncbi:hypothetical protein Ddc_22491 [Ditylenchus destructor]|nr:hypothetical protein Ddc_22491 [Ditylenchus destructor]